MAHWLSPFSKDRMKRNHHFTKFMMKEMKEVTYGVISQRMRNNKMTMICIDWIKVIHSAPQV